MIDRSTLPKISNTLQRLDVPVGRHGRTVCPIHRGDNRQAFSYDDAKGQWFCFRCNIGGDVVRLVEKALQTDFKGALKWLGIEPGQAPAPDPAEVRRRNAKAGLKAWADKTGKELRFEFYVREKVITRAQERLQIDPDDAMAWNWLSWSLTGHAALEYQIEALGGDDRELLEIFRQRRTAA